MERHEVVIVGAGAAGLTTAISLARLGVEVLVLESRPGGSSLPRATVLSMRSMEIMRCWGLEESVRAGADEVEMTMLELPTAARAAEGTRIDVGLPTAAQSAVLSPTSPVCVAQDHLEAVLLEHLSSYATARVERGTTVLDVAPSVAGATITVRDATGHTRSLVADHVVGADGARSAVRSALGIEMVGEDGLMAGFRIEFRAPVWDVVGEHRHLLYATTEPGAEGVLLPAGQGDRWLFGTQTGGAIEPMADPTHDELVDVVRRAVGVPGLEVRIERTGRFSSGAQMAERFSRGDVLLVGDAAHRVTPRGGTGLNIAIADGFHLGWKLGWVLRGWAPAALLSTYELERRPAVAHNVERSSDPLGSRRGAGTELDVDLGGRIRHVWVDGDSTLDLLGEGLTLFVAGGGQAGPDVVAGEAGPPLSVVTLEPLAARSFGLGPRGALLVRPDGVPVAGWWAASDPRTQLAHAIRSLLGDEPRAVRVDPESAA
jgi:2-polyprenyl-6-methoxyphenol hydroxylase-like FAD-dependent oxidoreductase